MLEREKPPEDAAKTLDFYIERRNGKKRDYVFGVDKMRRCPHNHLQALSTGGTWYRCRDCNWAFGITVAYAQPLHNMVVGGLLNALWFAKEFGMEALQEVARTPKGQYELNYHLPALPEGMSFNDAVEVMDKIDVTVKDGGAAQLYELLEKHWVSPKEKRRRIGEFKGMGLSFDVPPPLKPLKEGYDASTQPRAIGAGETGAKRSRRGKVPSLPRGKRKSLASGSAGES